MSHLTCFSGTASFIPALLSAAELRDPCGQCPSIHPAHTRASNARPAQLWGSHAAPAPSRCHEPCTGHSPGITAQASLPLGHSQLPCPWGTASFTGEAAMTSLNSHSWLMVPSPGSCTAPREVVPVSPHRFQTLGSTQHKLPTSEAGDTSSPAHPSLQQGEPSRDRGRIPGLATLPWIPVGAQSPQ